MEFRLFHQLRKVRFGQWVLCLFFWEFEVLSWKFEILAFRLTLVNIWYLNVRIKIPRVPSDLGDDLVEFLVELLEVPSLILTFLGVLFHYCDLQGTRVKETSYSPMVPLCSELEFRQFSYLICISQGFEQIRKVHSIIWKLADIFLCLCASL